MALIEWREEYSVGVPAVDYEHKGLIKLINDAHERLQSRQSADTVQECLGEIYAQISSHFALEEEIMRRRDYDRYLQHKADHERLLEEIRDIMDAVEDAGTYDPQQLAEALGRWFGEHFRTEDARLHRYLP